MAGYNWEAGMSNNATEAYFWGEKPISKWEKEDLLEAVEVHNPALLQLCKKLPIKKLKEFCLTETSWHHTSNYFNRTKFYSVDEDKIENATENDIIELTGKKEESKPEERWYAEWVDFTGSRNHPIAHKRNGEGTVRGNWFYPDNPDYHKKNINGNCFELIRRVP